MHDANDLFQVATQRRTDRFLQDATRLVKGVLHTTSTLHHMASALYDPEFNAWLASFKEIPNSRPESAVPCLERLARIDLRVRANDAKAYYRGRTKAPQVQVILTLHARLIRLKRALARHLTLQYSAHEL